MDAEVFPTGVPIRRLCVPEPVRDLIGVTDLRLQRVADARSLSGMSATSSSGLASTSARYSVSDKRNLRIGFGIAVAVYVVFLAGMSAGQHWVTKCVRSHTVNDGPDTVAVCDFRVANERTIDIGTTVRVARHSSHSDRALRAHPIGLGVGACRRPSRWCASYA